MTVPNLAAKHNTSRTSIYRWKKDMPRLMKLAKQEGKGQYKRVSLKRKMYNEEYTAAEKLAVVRELKSENPPSVRLLAQQYGANHRSIYRWRKDEARLIKLVELEGKGECKRAGDDPLVRVKDALQRFYHSNYQDDGEQLPLTGTTIAAKAKQARDDLLAQHAISPFLNKEEVKALTEFTASTSWGRKIAHKFGWKNANVTGATASDSTSAAAGTVRPNESGLSPGAAVSLGRKPREILATNQKKMRMQIQDMKLEINKLKRQVTRADEKATKWAIENAEYQRQLMSMKEAGLFSIQVKKEPNFQCGMF